MRTLINRVVKSSHVNVAGDVLTPFLLFLFDVERMGRGTRALNESFYLFFDTSSQTKNE